MKINRTCCNALIGTEQEQINQLYEFVKALAGNYFEGFEIMGTYSPTVNYNKKYMLVFFEGSTYVKTVDGDSVNFSPALNPDKWALFSSGTPADLSDLEKVIEGSDTVVVDVNEAGTALEIHADYENIVRPLERALKKPVLNPTETVLAGVDAQGEQVLLPVSSVGGGGGVKWYKHYIKTSAVLPQWVCILSTIPPLNPAPERLNEFISGLFENINNDQNNKNISVFAEAHLLGVLSEDTETSVIGFSVYDGIQHQGFFAITDLHPYSTPTTSSPIYIYSSNDIENKIGFLFDEYYCVEL